MAIRHKHLKLDQRKIDRARRALGTKTEQDTLERALDMVLAEDRIVRVLRRGDADDLKAIRRVRDFALEIL